MLALDHRIIGGIICGSIILLSTIAICIKYKIRKRNDNE